MYEVHEYLGPHFTATYPTCSSWTSALDQVFLRVPRGAPQMLTFWVCRPVHKSMPLLSPCLLEQHAVLVSTSTTLSPANCGCFPGGPRNGFHCTPPCQGWQPLSLCATTPEASGATSPQHTNLMWPPVAGCCGEHPSFSLVLHFGREAPEWGYLAPNTNLFPGLQENVAFCSVWNILSLFLGLSYLAKSQTSKKSVIQFSKWLWPTKD